MDAGKELDALIREHVFDGVGVIDMFSTETRASDRVQAAMERKGYMIVITMWEGAARDGGDDYQCMISEMANPDNVVALSAGPTEALAVCRAALRALNIVVG